MTAPITGSKDKGPREMSAESLANLPKKTPGHMSAVVRIFAPLSVITLITDLTARQRGELITRALLK